MTRRQVFHSATLIAIAIVWRCWSFDVFTSRGRSNARDRSVVDWMIHRIRISLRIASSVVARINAARWTSIYFVPRRGAVAAMIGRIRITLRVASPIVARINATRWADRPGYRSGRPSLNYTGAG